MSLRLLILSEILGEGTGGSGETARLTESSGLRSMIRRGLRDEIVIVDLKCFYDEQWWMYERQSGSVEFMLAG